MERAHQIVCASLAPCAPDRIIAALATLSALVARRAEGVDDVKLQFKAYTERLREYPADVVMAVLDEWPNRSQWWPTWFELHQLLEARVEWRRRVLRDIERKQEWEAIPRLPEPELPPEPPPMTAAEYVEIGVGLRTMANELGAALRISDTNASIVSLKDRVAARAQSKRK